MTSPTAPPPATHASGKLLRDCLMFLPLVALLALISRLWVASGLGILPDPTHLSGSYQHLPVTMLRDGLFDALMNLHSQPPLWNFLLGLVAKVCDAQEPCMIQLIWRSHVVLSIATAMCIFAALRLLQQPRWLGYVLSISYILSPAVFYYENFLLYAHFTSAVFALSCLCALLHLLTGRSRYFLLFCLCLAVLSLTWTLFHPIYILLVGGLLLAKGGVTLLRSGILALTLVVSLLPSVKNQMVFGIFSSGSWLGLNVSQVAPQPVAGCTFKTFAETPDFLGNHIGETLNDPRMIAYSKSCLDRSLKIITADPLGYVIGGVLRSATSLSLWPNEYLFPPLNWERFPRIPDTKRVLTPDNKIIIDPSLSRALTLALNLFALIALVELARKSTDAAHRAFFQVTLMSVVLFLGGAHAVNGPEQERMRYTLHPLFWGLYAVVAFEAVNRLRRIRNRRSAKTSAP
jgi:hypothetical protein